jgi:hypothetical protein
MHPLFLVTADKILELVFHLNIIVFDKMSELFGVPPAYTIDKFV